MLTDHDRPDVDEHEKDDVCELLQGEDKGECVVWNSLGKAIHRMESVARVGGRHYPLVMCLVERLVDLWVVQSSMYPVDEEVRERDEERELQEIVQLERRFRRIVVEVRISPDFCKEDRGREDGHAGEGDHGLPDLLSDLVLEVFGVREGRAVEDEQVGQGCEHEVNNEAKEPVDGRQRRCFEVKEAHVSPGHEV